MGAKYIQPSENETYLKIIFGRKRKEKIKKNKNDKEFNDQFMDSWNQDRVQGDAHFLPLLWIDE